LEPGKYVVRNIMISCCEGNLEIEEPDSTPFQFVGFPAWYTARDLGQGRLAKLDIRGHGEYLLSNHGELSESDIYAICGMPLIGSLESAIRRVRDAVE
jgi:hypothetical protein